MSTKNLVVRDEQRYLQISVGMATKSNSSQYFKIFSTMLVSAERKHTHTRSAFKASLLKSNCTLTPFVSGKKVSCNSVVHLLCLFLVLLPSSSVASSNQDIMRAKRGCISTLRAAGFSEHRGGLGVVQKEVVRRQHGWGGGREMDREKIVLCPA